MVSPLQSESEVDEQHEKTLLTIDSTNANIIVKIEDENFPFIAVQLLNNNNSKDILQQCDTENNEIEVKIKGKGGDSQSESGSVQKTGWRQYLGLLLAVLSSLLFSLVLLLVKVLEGYHPISLSVWRQFGNVIPSIPIVIYFRYWRKQMIFDQVWPLSVRENWTNVVGLGVRGFLGATAVILRFYALEYLTIADSTVVTYSGPIFIVIMAHFCLNEKCGVTAIVIGLWTLFGVILICRPPFLTGAEMDTKILIGTGITLGVVLCQSAVTILVRKIRKIHFSVMTLAFGVCGLLQSSILAISIGVLSLPQGPLDIFLTTLLALLSFLGQISLIMALKLEQAGPVSLIRTSDVLFAYTWQIIFLNVMPDLFSILGAVIVMIGVLVTALRKWISVLPEEDCKRKAFKFLLR